MNKSLNNKAVLITGANSGIGKAAALQFAKLGAHVFLACRSEQRGREARDEIRLESGNEQVDLMQVDMSSLASIRKFADEYSRNLDQLDVLIHNAANFDLALKQPILTEDGIETIFATNHVGVFLLTHLLLDLLKNSAPSRIITIASKGLTLYPNLDIEFDNLNGERKFSAQHAYYHSKLAQVMFTYELACRLQGSGVTANCIRVGNVGLGDDRLEKIPEFLKKLYSLKRKFSITPEQQAEVYVRLAADPEVGGVTGAYWDEKKQQVQSNKNSYNRATWLQLWEISAKMAGIHSD